MRTAGPRPAAPDRHETLAAQQRRLLEQACDVCGASMRERACRYTCPRCGYARDCSDP